MTYSEFKRLVLSFFREQLGASTELSIQPVTKNNQVILDGLIILESGCNVSPTLYLNYYYDMIKPELPPKPSCNSCCRPIS